MLSQYSAILLVGFLSLIDNGQAATACVSQYHQCGGIGWTGATCCVAGNVCVEYNDSPYFFTCSSTTAAATTSTSTSTVHSTSITAMTTTTTTTSVAPVISCAYEYAQCGGIGFTGPTCCQSGLSCFVNNAWFHNCYTTTSGASTLMTSTTTTAAPY